MRENGARRGKSVENRLAVRADMVIQGYGARRKGI
jgi:hypothetical protein